VPEGRIEQPAERPHPGVRFNLVIKLKRRHGGTP
jgi:hypothetical protein